MTRKLNHFCVAFVAALFILASGQTAWAIRPVSIEILMGNHPLLSTGFGDEGETTSDGIWKKLKDLELHPLKHAPPKKKGDLPAILGFEVTPDAGNPLQATLQGNIHIRAKSSGDITVQELKLVRDNPDGKWRIAPEEVDRTFKLRKKFVTKPAKKPSKKSAKAA